MSDAAPQHLEAVIRRRRRDRYGCSQRAFFEGARAFLLFTTRSQSRLSQSLRNDAPQAKHEARLRAGKPVGHASLRFDSPKRRYQRKHQQRLAHNPVGDAAPAEKEWEEGTATNTAATMTPQGHFNERTVVRVIA